MKLKNLFLPLLIFFLLPDEIFSQTALLYTIGSYAVKKPKKVYLIAQELKVDPELLVKINRFESMMQEISGGQLIFIPVFQKGYKYNPSDKANVVYAEQKEETTNRIKTEVKTEPKPVQREEIKPVKKQQTKKAEKKQAVKPATKSEPPKAEVVVIGSPPIPEKKHMVKTEKNQENNLAKKNENTAKSNNKIASNTGKKEEDRKNSQSHKKDNKTTEQSKLTSTTVRDTTRKKVYSEFDMNRLMLLDASIELNDAMLAGIKASLDSVNAPIREKSTGNKRVDELRHKKREKEREELKPYLEHLNDSLSQDSRKIRAERETVMARLGPDFHYNPEEIMASNIPPDNTVPKNSNVVTEPIVEKKEVSDSVQIAEINKAVSEPTRIINEVNKDVNTASVVAPKTKEEHSVEARTVSKDVAVKPSTKTSGSKTNTGSKTPAKGGAANHSTVSKTEHHDATTTSKTTITPTKRKIGDTLIVIDAPDNHKKEFPVDVSIIDRPTKRIPKRDTVYIHAKPPVEARNLKRDTIYVNRTVSDTVTALIHDTIYIPVPIPNLTNNEVPRAAAQPNPLKEKEAPTIADNNPGISNAENYVLSHMKSQYLVKKAEKAILEKKFKLGEDYLNKAIETWHDNIGAWSTLASLDEQQGLPSKALEDYRQSVLIDPNSTKLYCSMGELNLKLKKKNEALQSFEKALEIDSQNIQALMGKAAVYTDWKKYDTAISTYGIVLKINHSYHYAYKVRGTVRILNRNFKEAVDDLTRFLIFEETDPSAYYFRGLAKIAINQQLDGCLDLSTASGMGYAPAEEAIKKSCD